MEKRDGNENGVAPLNGMISWDVAVFTCLVEHFIFAVSHFRGLLKIYTMGSDQQEHLMYIYKNKILKYTL